MLCQKPKSDFLFMQWTLNNRFMCNSVLSTPRHARNSQA
jgi:hypothetical protein